MYEPRQLSQKITTIPHGKSRIGAIYSAIQQADENHDLTYRLEFRLDLCYESCLYEDGMDMMVVFPQVLALVDKHPDIPLTAKRKAYKNGMDCVLWYYKYVLEQCVSYYQIPLDDVLKLFEDFKQRSISFGYNLKPYYKFLYNFYDVINETVADRYFLEYQKLPVDGNGDCNACERNCEIIYYLDRDKIDMADKLAKDIEEFKLFCGKSVNNKAFLRMNFSYLSYYMRHKDYENAKQRVKLLERYCHQQAESEYDYADDFLRYYTYTDIGKALTIYKRNWKEWSQKRCPRDKYFIDKKCFLFFKELSRKQESGTIKLKFDSTFPLYSEKDIYNIEELKNFYYDSAMDIALKFEKRNGADYGRKDLIKEWEA